MNCISWLSFSPSLYCPSYQIELSVLFSASTLRTEKLLHFSFSEMDFLLVIIHHGSFLLQDRADGEQGEREREGGKKAQLKISTLLNIINNHEELLSKKIYVGGLSEKFTFMYSLSTNSWSVNLWKPFERMNLRQSGSCWNHRSLAAWNKWLMRSLHCLSHGVIFPEGLSHKLGATLLGLNVNQ